MNPIVAAALLLALAGCVTMLASMLIDSIPNAYAVQRAGMAACIVAMGLLLISGLAGATA